jgi:hypothetical protein
MYYIINFIRLLVTRILYATVKLFLPMIVQNQCQTFAAALVHDLNVYIAVNINFLTDLAKLCSGGKRKSTSTNSR